MLGNCDSSIIPSSSTTTQCPQNQLVTVDDHTPPFMAMASSPSNNKSMAAAAHDPLKCPRCDSSNTKFCYYNNYSLSQPRHFCKACKRYWTRGGTLRNVPVGGGCRKNKRHKRHSDSSAAAHPQQIDLPPPPPPSSSHLHNPLFYGNPLELSFPFSSFRVSSDDGGGLGFDQINSLGLGFSSGNNGGYKNGSSSFSAAADNNNNSNSNSNSNNNNNSIFFGSSSTMASLLSSTQKFGAAFKDFHSHGLMPYEETQMPGTGNKQVKAEGENRFAWNPNPNPNPNPNLNSNPMEQINSSDPSSLVWNTSSISAWFDPSTMGSSVPSLI